jgi:hypothetical protein
MKNLMTPNITLAIILVAAMDAAAVRAAARRPEPRWGSGAGSAAGCGEDTRLPGSAGQCR